MKRCKQECAGMSPLGILAKWTPENFETVIRMTNGQSRWLLTVEEDAKHTKTYPFWTLPEAKDQQELFEGVSTAHRVQPTIASHSHLRLLTVCL